MKGIIDINCDMGESFGRYSIGSDHDIMPFISSCNIACGFHAGDPLVMKKTIGNALDHQLNIGAHPSYPDLQGFGRRSMNISSEELFAMITYQIGALKAMAESMGASMSHVKPHGALYNDMAASDELSRSFLTAVQQIDPGVTIFGLPGSSTSKVCEKLKIKFKGEFFADRNYEIDGSLVSRSNEDAILHDPNLIAERVLDFILTGSVNALNGEVMNVQADTICIHGDHPQALIIAEKVYQTLEKSGITLAKK